MLFDVSILPLPSSNKHQHQHQGLQGHGLDLAGTFYGSLPPRLLSATIKRVLPKPKIPQRNGKSSRKSWQSLGRPCLLRVGLLWEEQPLAWEEESLPLQALAQSPVNQKLLQQLPGQQQPELQQMLQEGR